MRTGGALLLLGLASCGADDAGREPRGFELSPVVQQRLGALRAEAGPSPPVDALAQELEEEVFGLVEMLAYSDGRMREIPLESIADEFGAPAIPTLVLALTDEARDARERVAAIELLANLDHPSAVEALLTELERSREAYLRRHCAWHLGEMGADWVVPRLCLRLKYEQDHEAFLWLAGALARFRNHAGQEALLDLVERGVTEELRAQAAAQVASIAEIAGLEPTGGRELARLWSSVDATLLPQPDPSPELRLELWRLVSELGVEHFQLRGVDDSRYALSRLGPWAAPELALALADEDFHVRLHVAQVLERMGPRATAAGAALLEALAEPALAPTAAEALGRVGHPPARAALETRTTPEHPHALRVAAVRALGRIGMSESVAVLVALFEEEEEPRDLRNAAATALVLVDEGPRVAPWLLGELTHPDADRPAAELALETWLVRGAEAGREGYSAALEAWRTDAGPPGITPPLEKLDERRSRRAQSLSERIEGLR